MPWWVWAYLAYYIWDALSGLRHDVRQRRPTWFLPAALASLAVAVSLVAAVWYPAFGARIGIWAAPLALGAVAYQLRSGLADLRAAPSEYPATQQLRFRWVVPVAILWAVAIEVPVVIAAATVVRRAL
jgi:hypothetical protein